jgi:ABC-type branched-subunit amino acid transport system ATPase component
VLLEVVDVHKSFGGVAAVAGASFGVVDGSVTALIGPNGAGKTTVFNVISGFLRADRGTVVFAGERIERRRSDAIARSGLVRAFQSARVLSRMTVIENIMLAGKNQRGEQFGAAWFIPRQVARREAEVREQAWRTIDQIGLSQVAHALAGTLSGGQRKLLELGRALMVEPRLILLDEPMAGVAPALAAELLERIEDLRSGSGVTVLVIEHDMDVVMSISDKVVVMDEGRVIAEGRPLEIQRNERVIEAYLGRSAGTGASA